MDLRSYFEFQSNFNKRKGKNHANAKIKGFVKMCCSSETISAGGNWAKGRVVVVQHFEGKSNRAKRPDRPDRHGAFLKP